jgi:hypothetical protein
MIFRNFLSLHNIFHPFDVDFHSATAILPKAHLYRHTTLIYAAGGSESI